MWGIENSSLFRSMISHQVEVLMTSSNIQLSDCSQKKLQVNKYENVTFVNNMPKLLFSAHIPFGKGQYLNQRDVFYKIRHVPLLHSN